MRDEKCLPAEALAQEGEMPARRSFSAGGRDACPPKTLSRLEKGVTFHGAVVGLLIEDRSWVRAPNQQLLRSGVRKERCDE